MIDKEHFDEELNSLLAEVSLCEMGLARAPFVEGDVSQQQPEDIL